MRYHDTSIRMAKIKKSIIGKDVEKMELLYTAILMQNGATTLESTVISC